MAFAISLGSANLQNVEPGAGSLEDLVQLTRKNAYYTKKPNTDAEEESLLNFIRYSRVGAKIVDGDAIIVGTLNEIATDAAKRGKPTHLKMQAILPYAGESYECFARIQKLPQESGSGKKRR